MILKTKPRITLRGLEQEDYGIAVKAAADFQNDYLAGRIPKRDNKMEYRIGDYHLLVKSTSHGNIVVERLNEPEG